MIYSDLYIKKDFKLSVVIGFLMVIFVVIVFLNSFLKLASQSKASIQVAKRVEVVNLSPMEASIFWQTDQPETGWVAYGPIVGMENNIALDEKDSQIKGKYKTHLAKLRDLTPGKKYFFKMISDNSQVITQPNGSSFSFTTPQNSTQNTSVIYGIILQPNSNPLVNANVIFSLIGKNIYPFFAETKEDGSWLISINQIYTKDGQNNLTLSKKEKAMVEIITSEGEKTTMTLFINNPQQTQTLPTFVFGKDRDYPENNVLSASTNLTKVTNNNQIEITYPLEGSLIPGNIPLMKGTGLPNSLIEITVNSNKTYSAKVTCDSSGNWSYLLPENLELGPHSITIKTKDKAGNTVVIKKNFTIIAQQGNEGRVLGTATGEPTIILTVTSAPTYPVSTILPTVFNSATSTPGLLKSGNNFAGSIFGGLGLIIIGGGILLVF